MVNSRHCIEKNILIPIENFNPIIDGPYQQWLWEQMGNLSSLLLQSALKAAEVLDFPVAIPKEGETILYHADFFIEVEKWDYKLVCRLRPKESLNGD